MNTYCLSCKKDTRNIDLFAIIKSLHLFRKDLVRLIV